MQANQLKSYINYGLVLSFIGILIAFPFQQFVFGGLFFAFFSAALIGGLADSFAVKAIFGQPLHIKWPSWVGTNIIVRHRVRLIDELASMVQNELLSPTAIRGAFEHKSIAVIIESFVKSETGEQTIRQIMTGAIRESVKSQHLALLLVGLKRMIGANVQTSKPSHYIAISIKYLFHNKLDDTSASFILRLLKPLIESEALKRYIQDVIQQAINKYEKNNRRRQVANQIAKIDAKQLTEKLLAYAEQFVFELVAADHPLRIKLRETALKFAHRLETDSDYEVAIDERIQAMLQNMLSIGINATSIKEILTNIEQAFETADDYHVAVRLSETVTSRIYTALSQASLQHYDAFLLDWLVKLVESKQHVIGNIVKEKLYQFSAEDLVLLVEDKAGKDLQFIRLNGTVIGGFIGAILFIVQLLLGGELL